MIDKRRSKAGRKTRVVVEQQRQKQQRDVAGVYDNPPLINATETGKEESRFRIQRERKNKRSLLQEKRARKIIKSLEVEIAEMRDCTKCSLDAIKEMEAEANQSKTSNRLLSLNNRIMNQYIARMLSYF
ncbi:hypothetical protein V6N13_088542 [Hibiscus sabdariffa]|uniref:BZIP domain-containing protein n=1 Tax=Hibiscus sabdariffa TaxID=183260 RepID=A0ABR2G026_9ROSI